MGVILNISVNFFILKAALSPLVNLRDTMDEVHRGNLQAQAAREPVGDPTVNRLSKVLNSMLDELSTSHKQLKEIAMPPKRILRPILELKIV